MLTLITNARVFAPEPLGLNAVLVSGNRIAAVEASIDLAGERLQVLDAGGRSITIIAESAR